MAYFDNLPNMLYDLSGVSPLKPIVIKNILARAKIRETLKNPSLIYYTYNIKGTDTPEIIADKYYGNSNRHWIILLANDIVDPQYDWPLSDTEFGKYIISKYRSISNAKTSIHHYEKLLYVKMNHLEY